MVLCYNKYGFATEIEIERSLLHEMDVIFQKACGSHSCSVGSRNFDVLESSLFRNLELFGLECLVNVVLLNGSGGRIPKNWRFSELGRCLLQALEIHSNAGIFALESLLFLSMLVTNDVALITFVPFTCSLLQRDDQRKILLRIVVIEAAAANLGSMATPIGNPQNLYLYSTYSFSLGTFFKTILPIVGISYIGLLFSLLLIPQRPLASEIPTESHLSLSAQKKNLIIYSVLGVVCLATVAGFVTHVICFCVVLLGMIVTDRALIRRVDWELLLTFVCFFLFPESTTN